MENKYIELLLKKCVNLSQSKILFINYDIINQDFVDKLVEGAKTLGVEEVYLDKNDIYQEHDILKNIELNDIESHPYFDRSIWNEYAERNANFLIFRAPNPGLMDNIDPQKIAFAEYIKRKTSSSFRQLQFTYQISWCISVLPNENWANNLFDNKKDSMGLLQNILYKACMIDKDDPIKSWDSLLKKNKDMINKLNNMKIKLLHYKNQLGTDLKLELLNDSIWCDASTNGIVNMPSYEIFSTPDFRKTNGIVYGSKPLVYNGGKIDKFWLKFENGKVIDFGAEKGKEILESIINSDEYSCYLGECALVEHDCPISNIGLNFGLTLLDENASCHLALGEGFSGCSPNNNNLTSEELINKGINVSKVHVDFMIGTSDLQIEAETFEGKKVKILKNGNFSK